MPEMTNRSFTSGRLTLPPEQVVELRKRLLGTVCTVKLRPEGSEIDETVGGIITAVGPRVMKVRVGSRTIFVPHPMVRFAESAYQKGLESRQLKRQEKS